MEQEDFLGTGWSFPPSFNLSEKSVNMVSDEEDIRQSLDILLSTRLGERVLLSEYGCGINTMPFENITVTFLTKMKAIIKKAILLYEPRIDLEEVFFTSPKAEEGIVKVQLQYRIRATNSRLNYVYPFYLKEGTYIKT
ncbi:GPW/gp25 family protein [Aureisphaera galaxeae]|uniref:GPW/gp25 family protein n=1 Tax=Aureisphaera galaxeae TaxID=1538023 RepID=UPI00234FD85B|nr:GPW/gp25 family protein [Aureisphaera galaxeae]MDC8005355.1 GPW/gp25 family protein [Aureisphaera galaxeae]